MKPTSGRGSRERSTLAGPSPWGHLPPVDSPTSSFCDIRIHGDYHLGQTLKTPSGFVLIDFEGEPTRPWTNVCQTHCALKDVAGMLRSFEYAVAVACERAAPGREDGLRRALPMASAFPRRLLRRGSQATAVFLPSQRDALRAVDSILRDREGPLRAGLRADQPARLGSHPRPRHAAPARCLTSAGSHAGCAARSDSAPTSACGRQGTSRSSWCWRAHAGGATGIPLSALPETATSAGRCEGVARRRPLSLHRGRSGPFSRSRVALPARGRAWSIRGRRSLRGSPGPTRRWRGVPLGKSLVIYELHVGTFTPEGTFRGVIERLP